MTGQSLRPETAPVVGSNLVESVDDIVEGIGFHLRRFGRTSVQNMAKVIDGLLAIGLLPDDRVRPQPVQFILLVVVEGAAPRFPLMRRFLHTWNAIRCVLQVAPRASGTMIEFCRVHSQGVAEVLRAGQPAACAQNFSQVFRQSLVYPE